jgi:hypothetical protein
MTCQRCGEIWLIDDPLPSTNRTSLRLRSFRSHSLILGIPVRSMTYFARLRLRRKNIMSKILRNTGYGRSVILCLSPLDAGLTRRSRVRSLLVEASCRPWCTSFNVSSFRSCRNPNGQVAQRRHREELLPQQSIFPNHAPFYGRLKVERYISRQRRSRQGVRSRLKDIPSHVQTKTHPCHGYISQTCLTV